MDDVDSRTWQNQERVASAAPANGGSVDVQGEANAPSLERREALNAFWIAVKRLPAYARLVASLVKDRDVPHKARAVLIVGGAYLVSPVDLVPGVIPVAGQLDDLYVVLMAIRQAIRMSPPEAADRHLDKLSLSREMLDEDLAAVRRLVRVGIATGARWSWRRLRAASSRLGQELSQRRGGSK